MTRDREVVVIGAGLAGLAAGVALLDASRDVEVIDERPEPGGLARTDSADGHSFARGPQSFLGSSPSLGWLCVRAGCDASLLPARGAKRRFVYRAGRLHELPSSPLAFATSDIMGLRGKLRLLAEPIVRSRPGSDDESVVAFFRRRLGPEATDALVVPFVSGVHAGDADRLEARSAFRRFWDWERAAGSLVLGSLMESKAGRPKRRGIWSFAGGLNALPDALGRVLAGRLTLGARVSGIERMGDGWRVMLADGQRLARRVILAVPPPAAARLLAGVSAEAARLCEGVAMAPVAVVHLGGRIAGSAPEGFGVLVHRDEGLETLGIVFSSALFPGLAPEGHWLQAAYVGGRQHPAALERTDDDLAGMVREATQRIMGFDPDGGVRRIVRHPLGIPQLEQGHARRVERLRAEVSPRGGLSLAGSWLDGIGLEAAAASGRRAALEVLEAA